MCYSIFLIGERLVLAAVTGIDIAFTAFDILKGSIALSIPLFAIAFLGSLLHKRIAKRFKFSWIASAFLTALAFSLAFAAIAYALPVYLGFQAEGVGVRPPELQLEAADWLFFALGGIFKIAVVGIISALIAMPFILVGGLVKDWLAERKWNQYLCLFASVFVCVLIASALLLFFFGWVFQGMIYLLYFAG